MAQLPEKCHLCQTLAVCTQPVCMEASDGPTTDSSDAEDDGGISSKQHEATDLRNACDSSTPVSGDKTPTKDASPELQPDKILFAFASSMRHCARAVPRADASCAIPALLGILHADGASDEATMIEAMMALSFLVAGNAIHRRAAHDAGAVAACVSLLQ